MAASEQQEFNKSKEKSIRLLVWFLQVGGGGGLRMGWWGGGGELPPPPLQPLLYWMEEKNRKITLEMSAPSLSVLFRVFLCMHLGSFLLLLNDCKRIVYLIMCWAKFHE